MRAIGAVCGGAPCTEVSALEYEEIYSLPELYEIAFSYRDVAKECDFLADVFRRANGRAPVSVPELACGPAEHARELARRGLGVTALDLSPEMVDYAAGKLGESGAVVVADMADFTIEHPVDLAFTMLDSLPYLTTNEQLLSHFRCVSQALSPGGVYVVELRHPSDALPNGDHTTEDDWVEERDGLSVRMQWGLEVEYDPIAQTEHVLSRVTVSSEKGQQVIDSWGTQRPLLPQELLLFVTSAGGWRFLGWWGEFDLDRQLGANPEDWRMIVALQRE